MIDWLLLHLVTFQSIIVNATQPCFLNQTAGPDIFQNCGMGTDYLKGILSPWQWITGGWFSMILVAILVAFTYIKYHKAVYPMITGTLFLPIAYFLFPTQFFIFAGILTAVAMCILVYYIFTSQTNET